MKLVLTLPDIKAISRNDTTGHYINYKNELNKAQKWMKVFGKRHEYHFTKPVDVFIDAYFDVRLTEIIIKQGTRSGKKSRVWGKAIDTPNIDDKIFTDILIRWVNMKQLGKMVRVEQSPWFLENDDPQFLRYVQKRSHESDHFKVVITIIEIDDPENIFTYWKRTWKELYYFHYYL